MYSDSPNQTTLWKLHSILKGRSKNIYKASIEMRFELADSGVASKVARFFHTEPEIIYNSMRMASSLLVAPNTRNLAWDLATMGYWSGEKLHKVDPANAKECVACGDLATTYHTFFTCELSTHILNLTRLAISSSGLPNIRLTERSYLLINPPRGETEETKMKAIRATIANSLNFRRQLIYTPTLCFSNDLFLKVFQDSHRHAEKIFLRSGGSKYPWFIVRGDLESLNLRLPTHIKSPLLKFAPVLINQQIEARTETAKAFDKLLDNLFPNNNQPKPTFTGEQSVSIKVLTSLMAMNPNTVSTREQIISFLSSVPANNDHLVMSQDT